MRIFRRRRDPGVHIVYRVNGVEIVNATGRHLALIAVEDTLIGGEIRRVEFLAEYLPRDGKHDCRLA